MLFLVLLNSLALNNMFKSLFLASPRIITIALAGCVTPVYRQENGTGEHLLDTLLQNDTDIQWYFASWLPSIASIV